MMAKLRVGWTVGGLAPGAGGVRTISRRVRFHWITASAGCSVAFAAFSDAIWPKELTKMARATGIRVIIRQASLHGQIKRHAAHLVAIDGAIHFVSARY